MKLRIAITGPKVHDVGYRYFLLGGAMSLRLPGFYASNFVVHEGQMVEVLAEGKESQINAFMEFVQKERPANAQVSNITTSDYEDDIPRRSEYAQDLTAMQMLKAIPTILKIEENTKAISQIAKNTELLPQIAKNTELIPQIAKSTEKTSNTADKIYDEVKRLREEIQPGLGVQLRQMQADIRALKERMGML